MKRMIWFLRELPCGNTLLMNASVGAWVCMLLGRELQQNYKTVALLIVYECLFPLISTLQNIVCQLVKIYSFLVSMEIKVLRFQLIHLCSRKFKESEIDRD